MNLLDKIKALWNLNKAFQNIEEAQKMDTTPVKPGWKTTEFWMTVLTNLISVVGTLSGVIPAQTAAIIVAAANGIYGVLRTLTKTSDPAPATPPTK